MTDRSSPDIVDALDRIWDIVHTPTKATNHRSAERHFMADFDAIRQIIKDARAPLQPATPTAGKCQKCGCLTMGEEAWVDGQVWCHPCADAVTGDVQAARTREPVAWRYRFVTSVDGREWSDWFIVDDPKSIPSREGQAVQPLFTDPAQAAPDLLKYANHLTDCRYRGGHDCDCGLDEIRAMTRPHRGGAA